MQPKEAQTVSNRLTLLEIFNSEIEADLTRERLEASGIEAYVSKDDAGGMRPDLQLTRGVRLLVVESEIETARKLLQPAGFDQTGGEESWTCPGCSEKIEGQFTECWQCGTSRLP